MTKKVTMKVVDPIPGVWTPWADVLCRKCHDALGKEVTAKREIKWPEGKREGDGQGWCTSCGAPIWVHAEIALLTRLRKMVGGEMQQTGGMCAALALKRPDGKDVVVTALDGPVVVAIFEPEVWGEGEPVAMHELPEGATDEAAATVIREALQIGGRG